MIPPVPCKVCGDAHRSSKCSELNPPPPEGLPNPDGGGKHAQNPIEEDDSLEAITSSCCKKHYVPVRL